MDVLFEHEGIYGAAITEIKKATSVGREDGYWYATNDVGTTWIKQDDVKKVVKTKVGDE